MSNDTAKWQPPLDNPLDQTDLDTLNKVINACPGVHDNVTRAAAAGIDIREQATRCDDMEAVCRAIRQQFFGID